MYFSQKLKKPVEWSNCEYVISKNYLDEINVSTIIDPRWVNTIEVSRLDLHFNCNNNKEIMNYGRGRNNVKSQYLWIIKAIHQSNVQCENLIEKNKD